MVQNIIKKEFHKEKLKNMLLISKVKENLDILELESKEVEVEDLIERFIILDKLERSNKQSESGQVTPHAEFKKEVLEWFK